MTNILPILDELDALWEANDDVLDELIGPYLARLHNSYPILSSELRRAMKVNAELIEEIEKMPEPPYDRTGFEWLHWKRETLKRLRT